MSKHIKGSCSRLNLTSRVLFCMAVTTSLDRKRASNMLYAPFKICSTVGADSS